MSTHSNVPAADRSSHAATVGAVVLLLAEFAVIGLIFTRFDAFQCLANWPRTLCLGLRDAMVAGYGVLGALALFIMLFPSVARPVLATGRAWHRPLAINALGVVLALLPVLFLRDGAGPVAAVLTFVLWVLAVPVILVGALLLIAPAAHWRGVLARHGLALLACVTLGAAVPTLAIKARPLWKLDGLVDFTFGAVESVLRMAGYPVQTFPVEKIIGAAEFFVIVEGPCSGIEGIALVTLFVTLYLGLFRKRMRFPRALILYPLGIAVSVAFNILRIAGLVAIGIEGFPDLAIGAFHSHAGWLTFTLVALALIALAETAPQLKRAEGPGVAQGAAAVPPFWEDPVVARILPFAVFMLTALFASAFSQTPGVLYPVRMLLVVLALAMFWSWYRRLPWRIDPVAILAGAGVGILWIAIPVGPSDTPPYGALTGAALLAWFCIRGIGTIVIVPLVEELFFRDYLESRLRVGGGALWSVLAALVTAGLFAALHDRWIEAFVAGLVFSAVARRQRNITDAIAAHAIANAIVFAFALVSGNLAVI